MQPEVITSIDNQLAVITLTRQKALNALTHSMIKQIHLDIHNWTQHDDIAFLLFPSLKQKVYCAGGDIRWLYQKGKDGFHHRQMAFFADEYRLDYAIGKLAKPVVAIVDGFLIGGGMGLIMPATTVYATGNAYFSMPETGIGFFPDVGMSYYLNQCPGFSGLYLALTGQRINAFEATELGLVQGVINDEVADQIQYTASNACNDDSLYENTIQSLKDNEVEGSEAPMMANMNHIEDVFSAESVEAIMDELKHRSDAWSKQTLKQLQSACPLSLCVTFELMNQAKHLNQCEVYQLDHMIAYHFMN